MKDIKGYEGLYAVTEDGQVWSYRSKRFLKLGVVNGYLQAHLSSNGKRKTYMVHRLVAEAFIPNPNNLPHVSHLDETRNNNHVSNLVWSTIKDNMQMPLRKKRIGETHRKKILCITNGIVYDSQTQAAKELGLSRTSIIRVCKGDYFSTGGYRFKYYEE